MESFCISDDILDLGSRRAEARAKRMRQLQMLQDPTHFDVPNVADVSGQRERDGSCAHVRMNFGF